MKKARLFYQAVDPFRLRVKDELDANLGDVDEGYEALRKFRKNIKQGLAFDGVLSITHDDNTTQQIPFRPEDDPELIFSMANNLWEEAADRNYLVSR